MLPFEILQDDLDMIKTVFITCPRWVQHLVHCFLPSSPSLFIFWMTSASWLGSGILRFPPHTHTQGSSDHTHTFTQTHSHAYAVSQGTLTKWAELRADMLVHLSVSATLLLSPFPVSCQPSMSPSFLKFSSPLFLMSWRTGHFQALPMSCFAFGHTESSAYATILLSLAVECNFIENSWRQKSCEHCSCWYIQCLIECLTW